MSEPKNFEKICDGIEFFDGETDIKRASMKLMKDINAN